MTFWGLSCKIYQQRKETNMSKLHSLVSSREEKREVVEEILEAHYGAAPGTCSAVCSLDRIIDKLDPPEPAIMSYDEWVGSPKTHYMYSGNDAERPVNLLLWARYVYRALKKKYYGKVDFVWLTEERQQCYPFEFAHTEAAAELVEIVGKENLAEIRKLFY
jgi:hypothetical protein